MCIPVAYAEDIENMIKKIARICALWLALIALVFIYTDKNEYTWQFSGEELAQVLLSPDQANAHIKTLQLAMDQEKEAARQRTEQGIWGRPNQ